MSDRPEARDEIEANDQEILQLILRRADLVRRAGHVESEAELYRTLGEVTGGAVPSRHLVSVFRAIVAATRAASKPQVVSYWGPAGTFTHLAADRAFGASADLVPLHSISEVFRAVGQGEATHGVAPIENSLAGVVQETVDAFRDADVKICGELYLPIEHHLLSKAGGLSDIKRVYAGPQPAEQCRQWLQSNLPKAQIVTATPTARAAEQASKDTHGAAIANRLCADLLGLPILAENIQGQVDNRTRFLIIGHEAPVPTGRDKTTIYVYTRNRPGELYEALGALAANKVNVMLINSRPAPKNDLEYAFYLDLNGHIEEPHVRKGLEDLGKHALRVQVLGSYPEANAG